ncbi:hypothetical protein FHS79_001074 [Polymorphobacter multimanifer]|uniref:Uncharacterized protein n=1 Tax=Polymorphobacter multimanifer TaxID=1070431 RepID=A0A841LCP5_9SPHN|nr:hypothetical protein [Polymorphobacter multimanifer]
MPRPALARIVQMTTAQYEMVELLGAFSAEKLYEGVLR